METHSSSSDAEKPTNASSATRSIGDSNPTQVSRRGVPSDERSQPVTSFPAAVGSHTVITISDEVSGASPYRIVTSADPFRGFGGYCFMYFCRLVAVLSGWSRLADARQQAAKDHLLSSPRFEALKPWGACSLGTICCTVSAAGLIPIFSSSSIKSFLPLPFLLIVVLVAFRFGRAAGVLGTAAAAFLFAYYLFEPAGLAVGDPVARAHLLWMLIVGIVISDLLTRFKALRVHIHKL
jgi:hypothetical protein